MVADVMKRSCAVTTLVMVVLGCGTWSPAAMAGERSASGEQQPRVIEVTASQFEFSPSEIEVSVGESVRLLVRSADVEHGLAIPSLGVGATIPPGGRVVAIDFVASEPGRHQMICSVFCGAGHGQMRGTLTVVAAAGGGAQPTDGPDAVGDLEIDVLEPDFNVIALPTTLRLPGGKFAFRLTHRFSRPLDGEGHGNLLEDFFGFDSPALIGLEFRYGLLPGTQIGVSRGNDKNILIFGRQNILWQRGPRGVGLDVQVSFEGINNLRGRQAVTEEREYSGSVAAILSKRLGERASVYVEPTWVGNVNKPGRFYSSADDGATDDNHSLMVGLAARVRVRPTVYLLGEYSSRVLGFDLGSHHASFAIEKRAGGHTFQLNVSNGLGTTPAQIAQGASKDDWFIGFNIARKFY